MDLFAKILPLFLSTMAGFPLDRVECAAVNGDEFAPKESQSVAEEGTFSADALQRVRMLLAKISHRFKIWGEFVPQPPQLQVALACVFAFSTGAHRVYVPIERKVQPIARMLGGATWL